jgi:hypothetical protein
MPLPLFHAPRRDVRLPGLHRPSARPHPEALLFTISLASTAGSHGRATPLLTVSVDAKIANVAGDDAIADCFICRKHSSRGSLLPGGAVAEDELILVSHAVPPALEGRDGTTAYLGHLFVEPLRHAPGLADLTDDEARRVRLWYTRASRALREVAGAEHVYAAAGPPR